MKFVIFSTNVDAQGLNEEYSKIGMEVFHAFSGLNLAHLAQIFKPFVN